MRRSARAPAMADQFHADEHPALTETRVSGETVYDGVLLHVRRDKVRLPNTSSTRAR